MRFFEGTSKLKANPFSNPKANPLEVFERYKNSESESESTIPNPLEVFSGYKKRESESNPTAVRIHGTLPEFLNII